jgi:Tfp pilus assembly protein PilN
VNQQINLYQPIFRKEKIIFSARTIIGLALGLIVLLVLWSILVDQRIATLEAELDRQEAAEQRAIEQISRLQEAMPPSEPDATLQARVEQLRDRRRELQASLQALQRTTPAAEAELRRRFDALARQVPEGVWLTALRVSEQGRSVTLEGHALEARLVPDYLSGLASVSLLDGLRFRQVRLDARAEDLPGVEFTVSTSADSQEEEQ